MSIVIKTQRLILRELCIEDKDELSQILGDPETMKYYPQPFDEKRVKEWISWNIENYRTYKHGLWAVILKDSNTLIGDCGITMQDIDGERLPEIGYHINKQYCNQGYATEAADACIDYAFSKMGYPAVYTYTSIDNIPSIRVAEKNGMELVKYFDKEVMGTVVKEVLFSKNKG